MIIIIKYLEFLQNTMKVNIIRLTFFSPLTLSSSHSRNRLWHLNHMTHKKVWNINFNNGLTWNGKQKTVGILYHKLYERLSIDIYQNYDNPLSYLIYFFTHVYTNIHRNHSMETRNFMQSFTIIACLCV